MLSSSPFYFSSIRNLTVVFGSLFNNIKIQRIATDGTVEKLIKVPLAYGPSDKTITMLQQQDRERKENDVDVKISLPRLSFELTGINYDPNRKTANLNKTIYVPVADKTFNAATVDITTNLITIAAHGYRAAQPVVYDKGLSNTVIGGLVTGTKYFIIPINTNQFKLASTRDYAIAGTSIDITSTGTGTTTMTAMHMSQFNPVPYNYDFSVNIFVKYIDDGLQIIEQILPYFTPFYTVTLNDMPLMDVKRDVLITLTSVTQEDNYAGAVEDDRIIQWNLTFVANSWIYPPISDSGVIKHIDVNFFQLDTTQRLSTLTVEVNPITANSDDTYTINTNITVY